MESRRIFSKLNIKDYNNELEKILDNKLFSLDVKNILLSMLYRIETAYSDYENVKVDVLEKKEFIPYLLAIIKEKCKEIEFIKANEDESKEKIEVNIDSGKIVCYPNEKSLLSAIWYMGEKNIEYQPKYNYVREAIEDCMRIGNNMSQVEVIRDFNGWSWDVSTQEIDDIPYNLLYQSLLFLYGYEVQYMNLEVIYEEDDEIDENIFTLQDSKIDEEILISFYEVAMKEYLEGHEDILEQIKKMKIEKDERYSLLQDKKLFIQKVTDKKKEDTAQIEKIDKIVNNTQLLKEEYNRRNEKLPNKQKIFSISHLADKLEKEREKLLSEIKQFNKLLEPREFIKEKDRQRKEVEFLKHLDLDKKQKIKNLMIKFCKLVLSKAELEIQNLTEKEDIIDWIYRIRYYAFLPLNDMQRLKDVPELEESFKVIIKMMIKKAQQNKIWDIFNEDEEITYNVLKEIFYSKMIDLKKANIVCRYEDGMLFLQYYDSNMLEKETSFPVSHVKIKKKFKLFI